ncbi:uncharacterized protein SCODWIG_02507 [Saccharomycodes ludwigii]|uniref:FIT family protein YFT2 n=1 Tax=Saccharomycodes ludwigii TaxID=36035 RepID=A0A376B7S4_9ASCO|nr:uncharacterized protein SCODWIG_02507 [Saccharomycodes ludwigii]
MRRNNSANNNLFTVFTLILCPITLLLGNILSYFDIHVALSSVQDMKHSIINVYFTKLGWFWTSLVGWWCIIRYKVIRPGTAPSTLNYDIFMYISMTVFWYICSQSLIFIDSSLIDLIFKLTGGKCIIDTSNNSKDSVNNTTIYNSIACKRNGGDWIGGHDTSGHIFLTTLMLMFLLSEFNVFGVKAIKQMHFKRILRKLKSIFFQINFIKYGWKTPLVFCVSFLGFVKDLLNWLVLENPIILLVFFCLLWWWNFLVTAIEFHTILEQYSGLILGYSFSVVLFYITGLI